MNDIDDLRATVSSVYFIAFTKITDKDTRARMVIDGNNLQDALTELDYLRSQMRTEPCDWCDKVTTSKAMLFIGSESKPVAYCPSCGRKLVEPRKGGDTP